ncbi:MAG: hypothetical protein ACOYI5_01545 [Christensenellales bacterium]
MGIWGCVSIDVVMGSCAGTLRAMLARGICPTWSARADNIASRRLAEGVGFREFGDAYRLTL